MGKPKRRRGRGHSGQLTYWAPPEPEPAPVEPPRKPADPMHGYTVADLDGIAASVVRHNMGWWPAGDRADQHDTAWEGIVEHLCAAQQPPARHELMEAGRRALATEVKDQMRHRGTRTDGTNNGANFARYWLWYAARVPSPETMITDHVALRQILATLTPRQQAAVNALAVREDYVLAAQMLGIEPQTFRSLLGRARKDFLALWHEGEKPSRLWGCDRRAYRRETDDPGELARRAKDAAAARERRKALMAA